MSTSTATNGISAKGTILSFAVGATGTLTYTPIAAIRTINYSGSKLGMIDVTNMDSPGNYKEQIPSIFDGGDLTVEGVYESGETGRVAAIAAYTGRQLCTFKVQMPLASGQTTTGDTVTFEGYFSSFGTSFDYSKEITFSATISITGPVTYTTGS